MIRYLPRGEQHLRELAAGEPLDLPDSAIWIDLLNPTRDEELGAEAAIGAALPTREEMTEIEASSRVYRADRAVFMTADIIAHSNSELPVIDPITFALCGERLITIRYVEPTAFKIFESGLVDEPRQNGPSALIGLLDEIIDRLADVLESVAADTEMLGAEIFRQPSRVNFRKVVSQLGRAQGMSGKIRQSAASLSRVLIFARSAEQMSQAPSAHDDLEALRQDLSSVVDYSNYQSSNITFLLDAALGMINIEQNSIIKFFSVAAVVFLPPTLVASYFGMNFQHMSEFDWRYGEALALGLMVLSVVVPLVWFRRKGWL